MAPYIDKIDESSSDKLELSNNSSPESNPCSEPLQDLSDLLEALTSTEASAKPRRDPYVEVTNQPASKKFRYISETRSAAITGIDSTPDCKTHPTIKIHNYTGEVIIIVSCVTKDEPYRPHPHKLISVDSRQKCNRVDNNRQKFARGACTIVTQITEENNEYPIQNVGIQCTPRKDIPEALRQREITGIDPYGTGYNHRESPQSINLNAVRLCFQVLIADKTGNCRRPLTPVVSDVLYNGRTNNELRIDFASESSGSAKGGTQIILLCEKLGKEKTVVVFSLQDNNVMWEATAETCFIHKQVALVIKAPPFMNPKIDQPVDIQIQLQRETDGARSNSQPFQYLPDKEDVQKQYKRKKIASILDLYPSKMVSSSISPKYERPPRESNLPYDFAAPGPSNDPFYHTVMAGPSHLQHSSVSSTKHATSPVVQPETIQEHMTIQSNVIPNTQPQRNMRTTQQYVQNIQGNYLVVQAQSINKPDNMQLDPEIFENWLQVSSNVQTNQSVISTNMQFMSNNEQPKMEPVSPAPVSPGRLVSPHVPLISSNVLSHEQPMVQHMQPTSTNMQNLVHDLQLYTSNLQGISCNELQLMSPIIQPQTNMLIHPETTMSSAASSPSQSYQTMGPIVPATQGERQTLDISPMEMDMFSSSSLPSLVVDSGEDPENNINLNSDEIKQISSALLIDL